MLRKTRDRIHKEEGTDRQEIDQRAIKTGDRMERRRCDWGNAKGKAKDESGGMEQEAWSMEKEH